MQNPAIEQLIDAHLAFIQETFSQPAAIETEWLQFYQWLTRQNLATLWDFEAINTLIYTQILNTQASDFLIEQIAEHIRFALIHPSNEHATFEDVLDVRTIDQIALYISSKSQHRKKLIHRLTQHPEFAAMITQLIQHSIQDYIDNSMVSKKVPGVGRFMKMGKSVLESVTDTNLDDTVKHYLQKNIVKLSQLSEQVLNQHFDDQKLYHFQANLWHKIKKTPLSSLKSYIDVNDLDTTVKLGHALWDYFRQSDYLKQQVHDGVYAWYARNQQRSFDLMLRDLNIDQALAEKELAALLQPVIQAMLSQDYIQSRVRLYLSDFYYRDQTQALLKNIS